MTLRVGVCAPIRLYRDGISSSLARIDGLTVVASIEEPTPAAVAALHTVRPAVVVVDATSAHGADALRRIAEGVPGAAVVALAIPETSAVVVACAEAGVAAYTTRDATLDELVDTIRRAARGEVVFAPHIGCALMQRIHALAATRPAERARGRLTRRERDVVELIDAGLSNKQIAQRLSIELATVKNHVHNILGKLDVERRGEAAATVRILDRDMPQI